MQLAFYWLKLREDGIEAKGELIFPKGKKREQVILTPELEDRLNKACEEIISNSQSKIASPIAIITILSKNTVKNKFSDVS